MNIAVVMYRDKTEKKKKYQRIKQPFSYNNFHTTTIFNNKNIQIEQKDVEYREFV